MAKVRFVPNYAGYTDVLNGSGMQGFLDEWAAKCKRRADATISKPDGHVREPFVSGEWVVKTGAKGRFVRTNSTHARNSEQKRKTLTKAFNYANGG